MSTLFCLSGPLQPWSSESSIGSKQLESKPETDGSGTPQNNGGVRLHDFVSKTVGVQAGRTWKSISFHFEMGVISSSW